MKSDVKENFSSKKCLELAKVVQSERKKIIKYLMRFESDQTNIEEIIQDALIEAFRCIGNFQNKSTLLTWFIGISANMARQHVARKTKESQRFCSLDEFNAEYLDGSIGIQSKCYESNAELSYKLVDITGHISNELIEVFMYVCMQEHSYEEASQKFMIPIGTVRSRVSRSRALIGRIMFGKNQNLTINNGEIHNAKLYRQTIQNH